MTKIIVDAIHPQQIILFGSRAQGKAGPESDYDFMIIQDSNNNLEQNRRRQLSSLWRLLACFKVSKDILIYSSDEVEQWRHSTNHIIAHALHEGVLLYERP